MQTLYHYQISGEYIPDVLVLRDMIKSAISIVATLPSREPSGSVTTTFIYDEEGDLLHTSTFTGLDVPIFGNPITPNQLISFLKESTTNETTSTPSRGPGSLYIKTKTRFNENIPLMVEDIKNYSKMITDLGKAGIISIRDTNSFIANDSRMFKFLIHTDHNLCEDYHDQEWSVDCLGTMLCRDITSIIEDQWSTFKTTSTSISTDTSTSY
jgi:hypothetical protein